MVAAAAAVVTAATGWLNFSVRLEGKQEKEQTFFVLNSYLKFTIRRYHIYLGQVIPIQLKYPRNPLTGDQVDSQD